METNNHQIVDYSAVLEAQYEHWALLNVRSLTKKLMLFIRVKYFWMRERMPD